MPSSFFRPEAAEGGMVARGPRLASLALRSPGLV